jgi:hypothetical protein
MLYCKGLRLYSDSGGLRAACVDIPFSAVQPEWRAGVVAGRPPLTLDVLVSEDQFHPWGLGEAESDPFVDALPVRRRTEVHSISVDRMRPLDHVAHKEGPVPPASVLGHCDEVGKPHCSSLTAVRVGNAEFQRADGRRHDLAIDLDHGDSHQSWVPDGPGEPLVCGLSPGGHLGSDVLVEEQCPQADQLRGVGRGGGADLILGRDAHHVMVP